MISELIYDRIRCGKYFDLNLKPYSIESIEKVILDFELEERYEDCEFLSNFIKNRFEHDSECNFRNI